MDTSIRVKKEISGFPKTAFKRVREESGMRIRFFILALLISFTAAAEELNCGPGELRTRDLGKVKVVKSNFCTDKRGTILISKDFNKAVATGKVMPRTESANPGWIFCDTLKGTAEFVEIKIGKEWFELDRCIFPDGSYIDTASLTGLGI